jgi:hypothetical protein
MPHVTEPTTDATVPRCIVVLGSRVWVRDTDGEHAPVGRALLGRRLGDQVQVTTPGGVRLLTVVDVVTTAPSSSTSEL